MVRATEPQRTESWRSERAPESTAPAQSGAEMPVRTQGESVARPVEEARSRETSPPLIPSKKSVFDDDFFRGRPREAVQHEERAAAEPAAMNARVWESRDYSSQRNVQHDAVRAEVFHVHAAEDPSRVPNAASAEGTSGDPDELDIPAFLRRGN